MWSSFDFDVLSFEILVNRIYRVQRAAVFVWLSVSRFMNRSTCVSLLHYLSYFLDIISPFNVNADNFLLFLFSIIMNFPSCPLSTSWLFSVSSVLQSHSIWSPSHLFIFPFKWFSCFTFFKTRGAKFGRTRSQKLREYSPISARIPQQFSFAQTFTRFSILNSTETLFLK